jgi:uncharacterized coiled-coil protein SlyX
VAHLFDNAPDETHALPQPSPPRTRWLPIAIVAGLAVFAVASALLWNVWGDGLLALPSFTSATAPVPAEVPDKTVGLKEFEALQQQIAASAQSTAQSIAAQQAEIKRLSDQVSALAARIEQLQNPAPAAQATATVPTPPPAAPAAPAGRKRPNSAPKQPPGISVGGAPLPR